MESERDEILAKLRQQVPPVADGSRSTHASWVRGPVPLPDPTTSNPPYPSPQCRFFDQHGFLYLPDFATQDEVHSMKTSMANLVQNEWNPEDPSSPHSMQVFRTDQQQIEAQGRSDYFLDSATKIHYFAETDALADSEGSDDNDKGKLKREYRRSENKIAALNKAGHGMHIVPGPFRDYAKSSKISDLLRELGWKHPVVPQSMYIFKQAKIGGEVTSHQDSTFLYTTPRQTCIGLWLALDDATLENGCLWVRPGSHRESVRRQFARNPAHFGESLEYCSEGEDGDGDRSQPQMIFRDITHRQNERDDGGKPNNISWEGKLPPNALPIPECKGLYDAGFVPVPCNAGDLLAFCGELDHLSLPNFSDTARHTFQLHFVEGEEAGVSWSKENWLQYPKGMEFMKV
ncbi:hypothetical protein ACHAXS_013764 [Conticribra weissflogii]